MSKAQPETVPATVEPPVRPDPPTRVKAGDPLANQIKVVDAETGKTIAKVIEADAEKGKVTRYAVEGGQMVRDSDRFATVEEDRAIRIEWRNAAA